MAHIPKCIDVNEIIDFLGDDYFNEQKQLLENNEEAMSCLYPEMTMREVFQWSIFYGFIGFSAYLYIKKQVPCTTEDVGSYSLSSEKLSDQSELESSMKVSVDAGGANTRVNIQGWDKHSIKQKEVHQFLYGMRKYSKYKYYNVYRCYGWSFNPKYINLVMC